jgi:hypothetical protein
MAKHADMARRAGERVGLRGVVFLVARRLLRPLRIHVEWFRVLEQRPETAALPGYEPIVPVWVPGEGDPAMLTAFDRSADMVRRRLAAGGRAAVALDAGDPVAQLWIQAGEVYDEEGVVFRLGPDEVWVFDGVVAESRRGERIYPRLAVGVARDLGARGVTRLLATIDAVNAPSLRAAEVRGCTQLGSVFVLHAGGIGVLRTRWRGRRAAWRRFRPDVPVVPPA